MSGLAVAAMFMWPQIGRWVKSRRENRTLALLLLGWFVAQTASNLGAGTSATRAILSALVFPGLMATGTFVVSRLSHGSASRVGGIAAGAAASYCVFVTTSPSEVFQQDPWKYGLGIPVTIMVTLAVGWLRRSGFRKLGTMVLVALAAVHLALAFRSLAAICLVMVGLLLGRRPDRSLTVSRMVLLAAISLLSVWIASVAVAGVTARGWLGQEQREKQVYQSHVDGGYLVAGRPEIFASAKIIASQSLLGRGTSAELSYQEQREVITELYDRGVNVSLGQQERLFGDNGVNSHSLALGSWVRGGIMAFAPWVFILAMLYRAVMRKWTSRDLLIYPATMFMAIMATWDFLFSPWAPGYEITLGIAWSLALGVRTPGRVFEVDGDQLVAPV